MTRKIALVRHGHYNRADGTLAPKGIEDARLAAEDLTIKGIGTTALVLSSSAVRAVSSARHITEFLGASPLQPSHRIKEGGLNPRGIQNLDTWLAMALAEADAPPDTTERDLVVVTHAPMLAVAQGLNRDDNSIPYGAIHLYEPGTWVNPQYSDLHARILEDMVQNPDEY